MMRICMLLILAGLAACRPVYEGSPGAAQSQADSTWQLVWADEFSGDRIDQSAWNAMVMPDPHNEELQYYPGRIDDAPGANAWVEDGALVIEAREEKYEHRNYTSARLNTKGKKEFLYGRFEARMKLPAEVGMWPAFWLLGANIDTVPWPACGEIDIMEGKGRFPNWTSGAIHRGPDGGNNRIQFGSYWHVFAVEWKADQIRWYLDDYLYYTVDKPSAEDPAYWPFDHGHPFYIILNLAVGGWMDQGYPPPPGMAPQRLYVDYVRAYQHKTVDK